MKQKILLLLCAVLCLRNLQLVAQNKSITKLEKITLKDFAPISPVIDSNANAVVLVDIGSTDFEGNSKGHFTMVFKHTKRILLRNKNAFDEATIKAVIYIGADFTQEEKFEEFEATTYNLENGQVVETKLDKADVFSEKLNKVTTSRKFTFPNIKEGSIIEYHYAIKSPFIWFGKRLRSWYFQGNNPVLWSQYKVVIPPMYKYYSIKQGFLPYTIDSSQAIFKVYSIIEPNGIESSEYYSFRGNAFSNLWAIKDVPAFKKENYTSSSKNYISKIDFQLHSIQYTEQSPLVRILKSWNETIGDLMKTPDYSTALSVNGNNWFNDDLKKISGDKVDYEAAKNIYNYVRDNFSVTDNSTSVDYLSEPLKKIYQAKKGTVVDINLLLTAMLIHQGFKASPVILSTRGNGFVTESSAILDQYNYLITRVKIDTTYYLLDAAESKMGFGKIPAKCYNGSGRLVETLPVLIPLKTDDLSENKSCVVFVTNTDKGGLEGSLATDLGYFESMDFRDKVGNKNPADYTKDVQKEYSSDILISNLTIDSLKIYEEPITLKYDMAFNLRDEDIIYFNPIFGDALRANPFEAAERFYPVEMQYKLNETYNLNMEVPRGYKIDEMPKSTRVKLNDGEGMFEYITSVNDGIIQLRTKLVLNKANFAPDDYETLRNFYGFIVKKQAEQIVFKKIK